MTSDMTVHAADSIRLPSSYGSFIGRAIDYVAAAFLLAASALKGWQFAAETGVVTVIGITSVVSEFFLGVWLITGLARRTARTVAILTYTAFAIIAARLWLSKAATCGCFGRLQISPAFTMPVDVLIVAALLTTLPRVLPLLLSIGLPIAIAGALTIPLGWIGQSSNSGNASRAVSEALVGRRVDEIAVFSAESNVGKGKWTLLLYRSDCSTCAAKYKLLESRRRSTSDANIAVVILEQSAMPSGALEVGHVANNSKVAPFLVPSTILNVSDGLITGVVGLEHSAVPATAPTRRNFARHIGNDVYVADLGYVKPGSVHHVDLQREQFVGEPFTLGDSTIECGCTKIISAPNTLSAESDPITVEFATPDEAMVYEKSIRWRDASDKGRTLQLRIRSRIGLPLRVEPSTIQVSRKEIDQPGATVAVRLFNDGDHAIRLLGSNSSESDAHFSVEDQDVTPGTSLELKLVAITPRSRNGSNEYRVAIETNSVEQPISYVTVVVRP